METSSEAHQEGVRSAVTRMTPNSTRAVIVPLRLVLPIAIASTETVIAGTSIPRVRTVSVPSGAGFVVATQSRKASMSCLTSLRRSCGRRHRQAPRTFRAAASSMARDSRWRLKRKSVMARSRSNGSRFGSGTLVSVVIADSL